MGQRGRGKIGASYAHDPRVEERTHTTQKTLALEAKVGGAVPTHSLGVLGRLVWLSRGVGCRLESSISCFSVVWLLVIVKGGEFREDLRLFKYGRRFRLVIRCLAPVPCICSPRSAYAHDSYAAGAGGSTVAGA